MNLAENHSLDSKLLLGRYRVMRLLGEGGMGTVHLARVEGAEGFTRPVVVKRMRRDVRTTEEGNRLFIREAKILSKMQHPNIVGISDFGVEDGHHIMVLEYVHGYTLSPWLQYRQALHLPLPVDICLYIVRRILDALHYAHHFDTEQGHEIQIVHRDVAPDNVLLSNKAYVHLLDFGVASMTGLQAGGSTKSGTFRGKLCYAAPETVHGQRATPRSDQYSAAVLLLELLTGDTPFAADSIGETFVRMVGEIPPPPSDKRDDIPEGLDEALARALAKEPENRFESALAFSRELRRFQKEDDDDVAQKLKALVSVDFERLPEKLGLEGLKDREQALSKIFSVPPKATEPIVTDEGRASAAHAVTIRRGGPEDAPAEQPATVAAAPVAAPPAAAPHQLRGLLWGLLAVGGLIALGLGAAVALLSRDGGNGEQQVVVVGGERSDLGIATTSIATTKGPAVASSTNATNAPSLVAPEEHTPTAEPSHEPARQSAPPGPKAASKSRQQLLSAAVHKQSGAYQACFSQHLENAENAPKAILHFSVAALGGAAHVKVEPPGLATTPLGTCLKGAAARVQFPRLEEPVAFRVPVSARVSRVKGKP